jgi:hypothetical protein
MQNNLNVNIINGNYGGVEIDSDAATYMAAMTGTITPLIECAINELFLDLKGLGNTTNSLNIYNKIYAMYPLPPTTLSDGLINAVNPGTYDATAFNSPNYSIQGIDSNTTGYLDSNFNPVSVGVNKDDFCFGAENATTQGTTFNPMGSRSGFVNNYTTWTYGANYVYGIAAGLSVVSSVPEKTGVGIVSRTASNAVTGYYNAAVEGSDTAASIAFFNGNTQLLGSNNGGSPSAIPPTGKIWTFFFMAQSYNANEVQDMTDSIDNYNAKVIAGGR